MTAGEKSQVGRMIESLFVVGAAFLALVVIALMSGALIGAFFGALMLTIRKILQW